MKKNLLITFALVIFVAGLAFYGGMTYGVSKNSNLRGPGNFDRANFSGQNMGNRQVDSGFTNGEILSKDDQSITIKLRDGGSKIVLLSASTTVSKMTAGSLEDLSSGSNVMVTGTSNSDGSLSAKSIQLSPALPNNPEVPKQ
ncbi:MAG: hypothetical protein WCV69_02040 [Patescibacteria group bacterium]|jgi:hypothetical protein